MNGDSARARRDAATDYVRQARQHNGMFILVSGLPGSGKSHLLRQLSERSAGGRDSRHYAAADEFERYVPYSFVERILSSGFPSTPRFEASVPAIDVARVLISALADPPRGTLRTVLIDDAQWIDDESARALRFVTPRVVQRGVLLAVATRPPFEKDAWVTALRDSAEANALHAHHRIDPLSAGDIRALALERFGTGISLAAAEAVREASSGTFLGVKTLFDGVTASEVRDLHFAWRLPIRAAHLPESPYLAGYATLPEAAKLAAGLASIAHRELPMTELAQAAAVLGEPIDVPSAVRAGVLVESGFGATVAVAHSLIASAIDGALDDATRKQLHRSLAAVTGARASVVHALHGAEAWDASLAHRVDEYVTDAAARGRVPDASELLRGALELTTGRERERLIVDLALLHLRDNSGYAVLDLAAEIEALPPSAVRDCLVSVLRVYRFDADGARTGIQKLLSRQTDDPDTVTIQSYLMFMSGILTMRSAGAHFPEEQLELGRRFWREAPSDPAELNDNRLAWMVAPREYEVILDGYSLVGLHLDYRMDEVRDRLPGAIERALALPDSGLKIDAIVPLAGAAVALGDVEGAWSLAATGMGILEKLTIPAMSSGTIRLIHAHTLALRGRTAEAGTLISNARELAYDFLDVETRFSFAAMHAWTLALTGKPGGENALQEARRFEGIPWEAYASDIVVMAECELARVAHDPAAVIAATEDDRVGRLRNTQRGFLTFRAHALLDLERFDEAEELIDWLGAERGIRWQETWGTLTALRARLADARGDRAVAERLHREAAAESETLSPLYAALAIDDYGKFLARHGREDEAVPVFERAVRLIKRTGTFGQLPGVSTHLTAITDRGRHERVERVRSLTAREREVARLVAANESNAGVASTLFISNATARFHVSNVLRKLQVDRRTEVGTIMASVDEPTGAR